MTEGAVQNVIGPGAGNVMTPTEAALLNGNPSTMRSAFDLQTWVDAYNAAHPNAPIHLNQ